MELSADNDLSQEEEKKVSTAQAVFFNRYENAYAKSVYDLFNEVKNDRTEEEDEWLELLKLYKGLYPDEVLEKIGANRCKAFMRLTRSKVKTVTSRLMDLLFPSNNDKNWGIAPTPIPTLTVEAERALLQNASQQLGREITANELHEMLNIEAKKACDAMETEIEDILEDVDYRNIINKVMFSGNLYGTGILKGVLAKNKSRTYWKMIEGEWVQEVREVIQPYIEFAPIWSTYLDSSVTEPEDMRFVFQRHVYNKQKMYELSKRSDFNAEAIDSFMWIYPGGNAEWLQYELDLRHLTDLSAETDDNREGMYEVVEYTSFDRASTLRNHKVDVPDAFDDNDFVGINMWVLAGVPIRTSIYPIDPENPLPYFIYYYDKTDDSIYGEGVASIMRDTQSLFNSSIRAMIDNAAISAGPIIEANVDILAQDEDPEDIYPFRVFQRGGTGIEAQYQALRITNMQPYTSQYLQLADFFHSMSDEVTNIPRYLHGDTTDLSGAGRTAQGLSMMLGSAHIGLKDQVKTFDLNITRKFISALYYWLMENSDKNEIKGDYEVVAMGTTALIAKEIKLNSLTAMLANTNNPDDAVLVNRDAIWREIFKLMGLDSQGLIKSPEEVAMIRQQQAQQQQQMIAFEQQQQIESHKPKEVSIREYEDKKNAQGATAYSDVTQGMV